MRRGAWLYLVAGWALFACTESRSVDDAGDRIGPQGGRVSGGGAELDVPPDALAQDVAIGVSKADADLPALPVSLEWAGEAVAFTPLEQPFAEAVTLRLPAEAGASQVLRLKSDGDGGWERIAGARFGAGVAVVDVRRLGVYVAARAEHHGGAANADAEVAHADAGVEPAADCDPACQTGQVCVYGVCTVVCESAGGTGGSDGNGAFFCESAMQDCSDGREYLLRCEGGDCECSVDGTVVAQASGSCGDLPALCEVDVRYTAPDLGVPHHCPDAACGPGQACIDGSCAGGCMDGGGTGGTGGSEGFVCFKSFSGCTDGVRLDLECNDAGECTCSRDDEPEAKPQLPQGCSTSPQEIMDACGWDYHLVEQPEGGGLPTTGGTASGTGESPGANTSGTSVSGTSGTSGVGTSGTSGAGIGG